MGTKSFEVACSGGVVGVSIVVYMWDYPECRLTLDSLPLWNRSLACYAYGGSGDSPFILLISSPTPTKFWSSIFHPTLLLLNIHVNINERFLKGL